MNAGLADVAWPDLDDGVAWLLIVPLGATEQHGPHLPLTTDTEVALALAEASAEQLGRAVVAPPLAYGSSGEHEDFPGTISIGHEALERILVELCRSASARFKRILLLSAHGGNAEPLAAAVARLRREGRDVRAFSPSWGGDAHAGRTETSLMLALAPARVRLERAAVGNATPLCDLIDDLRAEGVRALTPNGVLGDPQGANGGEGEALLEAATAILLAAVDDWGWAG
jgi:mycofactocin precursor peptide peptidase